jgi:5'(3')-deoxyribonucleotidase
MKKTLLIDLDNVLVDFESGINRISTVDLINYGPDNLDEVPGIFGLMDPMPGALEAYRKLSEKYDTYIVSTAPWENESAWSDKNLWVRKHLGDAAYKRLNLSHHKNLFFGDYLIDDRTKNGVDKFRGEHIHFLSEKFPDWDSVLKYLI